MRKPIQSNLMIWISAKPTTKKLKIDSSEITYSNSCSKTESNCSRPVSVNIFVIGEYFNVHISDLNIKEQLLLIHGILQKTIHFSYVENQIDDFNNIEWIF